MNLQECLDKLARGKLSNTTLQEGGHILEKHRAKVVDHLNEALARLYTILPIKEKNLIVELYEGRTDYPLDSKHSFRKMTEESIFNPYDFYIRDTKEHPFEDDILSVIEVWDDLDRKRPINDPDNPLGVYFPQENLLIVKYAIDLRVLNIIYRAKHSILTPENLETTIELPENLFGALFSYVAYLVHSEMNTQEAVANSQKYLAEYQSITNEIVTHSTITPDKLVSDSKFIKRGWV